MRRASASDGTGAPYARLIIAGDATDLVGAIAAALPTSVERVAVDAPIDPRRTVNIAFVALSRQDNVRSDIARAQDQLLRFRAHLSDSPVIVVVSMPGPLERLGSILERLIGPEVRHQIMVAAGGERDRSLIGRVGARMLEAIGVHVYRLRAMT